MPLPSWATKNPSEMTVSELQKAREVVSRRVGALRARADELEAADVVLAEELRVRVGLPSESDAIPPYPADAVAAEAGTA